MSYINCFKYIRIIQVTKIVIFRRFRKKSQKIFVYSIQYAYYWVNMRVVLFLAAQLGALGLKENPSWVKAVSAWGCVMRFSRI